MHIAELHVIPPAVVISKGENLIGQAKGERNGKPVFHGIKSLASSLALWFWKLKTDPEQRCGLEGPLGAVPMPRCRH